MLHISLQPEYIAEIGGLRVTNSLLTSVLVTMVIVVVVILVGGKRNDRKNFVVRGIRYLTYELLKLAESITGSRKEAEAVIPVIATVFVFIVVANLLGLVPGFLGSFSVMTDDGPLPLLRSPNSDLNTTVALALIAVVVAQVFSFRKLGGSVYLRRFFDLSGPVRFFMGFFEAISEGIKVLSFSFRLFGNIFAGEVLLLVIVFLVPYFVPIPFMIFEVFVGVIQAFIFAILTLSFIKTASTPSINIKR